MWLRVDRFLGELGIFIRKTSADYAQVSLFDAAAGGYIEIMRSQLKADPALVSATDHNGWNTGSGNHELAN